MFEAFFPRPKLFLLSLIIWVSIAILLWELFAIDLAAAIGLQIKDVTAAIGLAFFVTDDFLFFYLYSAAFASLFILFWVIYCPHPWQRWSVSVTLLLIFFAYITVQLQVAVNVWERPFGDMLQKSFDASNGITAGQMYGILADFLQLAAIAVVLFVVTRFVASHYIFRWRQAMHDHYAKHWQSIRKIEGAAQRVQDDTMRFSKIMEELGVSMVETVMTLLAFLPILWTLSKHVTTLPLLGDLGNPLLVTSLVWALFGTFMLVAIGWRLPGIEFNNQKHEAALRKELVLGEDHAERASRRPWQACSVTLGGTIFACFFTTPIST